jgi:hypothetical protein
MINESINNCDIKSGAELPKCISGHDDVDSSEAEHLTPTPGEVKIRVDPSPTHSKTKRSKRARIAAGVLINPNSQRETKEERPPA